MESKNILVYDGILSEGYGIIPKKIMTDKTLNVYEKCMLSYMFSFTGAGKNTCFPHIDKITEDLNISKPTVIKTIKTLKEKNYLNKQKRFPKTFNNSNIYTLKVLNKTNEVYHESKRGLPSKVKQDLPSNVSEINSLINSNITNSNNNNTNTVPSQTKVCSKQQKTKKISDYCKEIKFDTETYTFTYIPKILIDKLKNTYLAVNYDYEIKKIESWLLSNPTKLKKNWYRFINNWFERCQQRGGNKNQSIGFSKPTPKKKKANPKCPNCKGEGYYLVTGKDGIETATICGCLK